MTKNKRIHLIGITVRLETIIERLNKAISPIDSKERVCIICEQITALHSILGDGLKVGVFPTTKSAHHDSAISKRPDGVYQAELQGRRDDSGQPEYEHVYGKSRLEVKEKLVNDIFKVGVSNG